MSGFGLNKRRFRRNRWGISQRRVAVGHPVFLFRARVVDHSHIGPHPLRDQRLSTDLDPQRLFPRFVQDPVWDADARGGFWLGGEIPVADYARQLDRHALVSTVFALVFGTLAGYVFSRFRFKARTVLFGHHAGSAVPGIALSLPLFIVFAA